MNSSIVSAAIKTVPALRTRILTNENSAIAYAQENVWAPVILFPNLNNMFLGYGYPRKRFPW